MRLWSEAALKRPENEFFVLAWRLAMQIKLSLAVCDGTVESDPQALLTMELDSHPSIETLGLSLANGKAALVRLQAEIVKRQVELMSTSQRRCDGCGLNRAIRTTTTFTTAACLAMLS